MGRGKNFNHKEKGHKPEIPKHGKNVSPKNNEHVEFAIETVADKQGRPIKNQVVKD